MVRCDKDLKDVGRKFRIAWRSCGLRYRIKIWFVEYMIEDISWEIFRQAKSKLWAPSKNPIWYSLCISFSSGQRSIDSLDGRQNWPISLRIWYRIWSGRPRRPGREAILCTSKGQVEGVKGGEWEGGKEGRAPRDFLLLNNDLCVTLILGATGQWAAGPICRGRHVSCKSLYSYANPIRSLANRGISSTSEGLRNRAGLPETQTQSDGPQLYIDSIIWRLSSWKSLGFSS